MFDLYTKLQDDPVAASTDFAIRPEEGGAMVPFELRPVQRQFLEHVVREGERGQVFIIVLKARRFGISSAAEFLAFSRVMTTKNYTAMVVAHEKEPARSIMGYFKGFFASMPEELRREYHCAESGCDHRGDKCLFTIRDRWQWEFVWGSSIEVSTASNPEAERGKGSNYLHLSEAAYYPDADSLMRALLPTRSKTLDKPHQYIIVESTAAGKDGWFYEKYWEAKEAGLKGDRTMAWRALFYPWFADPRYQMPQLLEDGKLPPDPAYDEEEAYLRRTFNCTDAQLAFRRYVIKNELDGDVDAFRQEYPATDEEAFRSFTDAIFPRAALHQQEAIAKDPIPVEVVGFRPVQLVGVDQSPLLLYHEPRPRRPYIIGVDPAAGIQRLRKKDSSDPSAFVVLGEEGGKLVVHMAYRDVLDVESLAELVVAVARHYNDAVICPERGSGSGYHLLAALRGQGYTRLWRPKRVQMVTQSIMDIYGWVTTKQTKGAMISRLLSALHQNVVVMNDRRLIDEAYNYSEKKTGSERYGPSRPSGTDDLLDALMIAISAWTENAPLPASVLGVSYPDDAIRKMAALGFPVPS